MRVRIDVSVFSDDTRAALEQLRGAFASALAEHLEREPPLSRIKELCVSMVVEHPIFGSDRSVGAGGAEPYSRKDETLYVWAKADYLAVVDESWTKRVPAFAAVLKTAIAYVPKARLTVAERDRLVRMIDLASAQAGRRSPSEVAAAGPIYVWVSDEGEVLGVGFDGPDPAAAAAFGWRIVVVPPNEAVVWAGRFGRAEADASG